MKYKPVPLLDKKGNILYYVRPNSEQRFWQRVKKTPNCWIWKGAKNRQGYGYLIVNNKRVFAHRYVWFLTYGKNAINLVCHKCDNPPCVNPNHLFEGTYKDNNQDSSKKGRKDHGHSFKLNSNYLV